MSGRTFVLSDVCPSDVCLSDVCLSDVCPSDVCRCTLLWCETCWYVYERMLGRTMKIVVRSVWISSNFFVSRSSDTDYPTLVWWKNEKYKFCEISILFWWIFICSKPRCTNKQLDRSGWGVLIGWIICFKLGYGITNFLNTNVYKFSKKWCQSKLWEKETKDIKHQTFPVELLTKHKSVALISYRIGVDITH